MLTSERSSNPSETELDQLISAASLRLSERDCEEIPINCSAVTEIKSHMLDRLIRLHLDAQRSGACVVLEHVNDIVFEVITLTRLDRMLRIRMDEGEARYPHSHLRAPSR